MADEPEVPQNPQEVKQPDKSPLASMFDRWQKEPPIERNIADEVKKDMEGNNFSDLEKSPKELNLELLQQLESLFPPEHNFVQFDYLLDDKGDFVENWMFTFDLERKITDGKKGLIVYPHNTAKFNLDQRTFRTSKGEFPEIFLDKNRDVRSISIRYDFDEDGKAVKETKIRNIGKPLHEGMEQIPTLDRNITGEEETISEPLNHQDYAQIKGYLTLAQEGKLIIAQSA